MHLSNILPSFLLASLISANPILLPSFTVPVSGSTPVTVPAGRPSSLTASIQSVLQALTRDSGIPTGSAKPPEFVSISIEDVGVSVPTLTSISVPSVSLGSLGFPTVSSVSFGLPSVTTPNPILPSPSLPLPAMAGAPPFSIPVPIMDSMPTPPSAVDSFGLPLITFPATPNGFPIFDIPTNKVESVTSTSLPAIGASSVTGSFPGLGISEPTIGLPHLGVPLFTVPSVAVPSLTIPSPSLNISQPTIGLPSFSIPSNGMPSLGFSLPTPFPLKGFNGSAPTFTPIPVAIPVPTLEPEGLPSPSTPWARIPGPAGVNRSAPFPANNTLSVGSFPTYPAPSFPSISLPGLNVSSAIPTLSTPTLPTITIPTALIPTLTLSPTIPPFAPPTYDPAALVANATKAIEVLEILIDVAKADGGVNAVTVPGVGVGVGSNDALVQTLLAAFFPLLSEFVEAG